MIARGKWIVGRSQITEDPDSKGAITYAKIVDALCEGEIEGIVGGAQGVYLNETRLQNPDLTFNFQNVSFDSRNGTDGQTYLPGFPSAESENYLGLEVLQASPIIKTITNTNVNAVRITMAVPSLMVNDSFNGGDGDIKGTLVDFKLEIRYNGGAWVTHSTPQILGKYSGEYARQYLVPISGAFPVDIRVTKLTQDFASSLVSRKLIFKSYTEIIDTKFRYPNTAHVGLRFDARAFPSLPSRAYDTKLLRVQVPVNYDPVTRVYSGSWDGTWKIAWTDNPAWCFRDLLLNKRYGLGQFVTDSQVDKWGLYAIAQYCDQLVPDGFGGQEPRFTCNLFLQAREEAYQVLADMASIFRAMVWWGAGQIGISQDSPGTPRYLYTEANVVGGVFSRQGSPKSQRHTVALVAWNDPADMCKRKVEYVEDSAGIARYGIRETEVVAFGCNSRGQAHRLGRWILYTERMETEVVTFKVGIDGMVANPGDIIRIADNSRAAKRIGGRIKSAGSSSVTLDKPFQFFAGIAYTLYTVGANGLAQSSTITNGPGNTATVSVSVPFASTPIANSVYVIEEPTLQAETLRVISVAENDKHEFEISAVSYNASKFAAIENGLAFTTPDTSNLTLGLVGAPGNLKVSEYLYQQGNSVNVGVLFSWDSVPGAVYYTVQWRANNGNLVTAPIQSYNTFELRDAVTGDYSFYVTATNSLAKDSQKSSVAYTVIGKTAPPADVTGFGLAAIGQNTALLSWNLPPDLDVRIGGFIVIRHSPLTGPAIDWNDGFEIAKFAGGSTSGAAPLLAGSYMARAQDSLGNMSINTVKIETDAPSLAGLNLLATIQEDPGFLGNKVNTFVSDNALQLGGAGLFSQIPMLSAVSSVAYWNGAIASGTYDFFNLIDLGAPMSPVFMTAAMQIQGNNIGVTVSTRPGNVSTWPSFTGYDSSLVSAKLFISTTIDDPNGSPNWSAWQPFVIGNYSGRAFRFQLTLDSLDPSQTIAVTALSVSADASDRIESGDDVPTVGGGYSVTYAQAFAAPPAVVITAQNLLTGDYWQLTAKTASGFTIRFYDSGNNRIDRTFDWVAKGYGAFS